MKNKILFLISLLFLLNQFVQGQNLAKLSFKWKKPTPFTEIPEKFKNEDAVMISQDMYLSNLYDPNTSGYLFSNYSLKQRIRILTKNGIDDITNYAITQFSGTTPVTIDARTIKKNGETIVANREDIKLVRHHFKEGGYYRNQYRITIPGVEVGDDVEIIYAVERKYLTYNKDIYLHTDYPVLKSTFTLYTSKGIVTDLFAHNGMPQGVRTDLPDQSVNTWTLENLEPMKNQPWYIGDNELPFVRIRVNSFFFKGMSFAQQVGAKSWGDLYDAVIADSYNKPAKTKGLEAYFLNLKPQLDSLNYVEKVSFFVNKINKDFKLYDELNEKSRIESLAELMKQNKLDETNLLYFYRMMFYYLKIPSYTVLAKNKYFGQLDFTEISAYQVSAVLYAFKDEQNHLHYLFPGNTDIKYNLDEVPYMYEDTKAVFLQKENPDDNVTSVVTQNTIGHMSSEDNIRNVNYHYMINDNGDANVTAKGNYTGMVSVFYRDGWEDILKDYNKKEILDWLDETDSSSFILDTIQMDESLTVAPFNFRYKLKSEVREAVINTGDKLRSLKIHPVPDHVIPVYSKNERTTTAFQPFKYTDNLEIFVEFTSPVTILNEQELTKTIENDIGSYHLSVTKMSPTVYKINSNFKNRVNVISKEKYTKLVDLNEAADQFKDLNIIYKIN